MDFLLPGRFKKLGAVLAPLGFGSWLAMQSGLVTKLLVFAFGQETSDLVTPYRSINTSIAITGFFCFLAGMYFLTFSKEKVEDEMVQKIRLDSFQFAALVQLTFIILGFVSILVLGDPKDGGLMLFFVAIIFLFWLSFISRFNYVLHFKSRK